MLDCIQLQCPSCGAPLDVFRDMDAFACGHCGATVQVQRRGGTVALRGVEKAIERVQAGTDKTAAELALVRYRRDLDDLYAQRKAVAASIALQTPSTVHAVVWSVLMWPLAIVIVPVYVWRSKRADARRANELAPIERRIVNLESKIDEKTAIAES
jgi:uncharacterized Zn finger protein (UPF0148 family)